MDPTPTAALFPQPAYVAFDWERGMGTLAKPLEAQLQPGDGRG